MVSENRIDALIEAVSEFEEGNKLDTGKPRFDLVPIEFNIGVAEALTFGANKPEYGPHNFRKGLNYSRLLGSIIRHTQLELAGVDVDNDSGLEHWKHAAASLAMYAFMKYNKSELDDRYKYEDTDHLVKLMYKE